MTADTSPTAQYVASLTRLAFRATNAEADDIDAEGVRLDLELIAKLNPAELKRWLDLAQANHVNMRALLTLDRCAETFSGHDEIRSWCQATITEESGRIKPAVEQLSAICAALEKAGAAVTVIKSLDHWPDIGSDLDLYTSGDERTVLRVMREQFQAAVEPRSWGDRLANKWNFKLPHLPELIEVHVQYLGQTGEQRALARRVIERSVTKSIGGHTFRVPAPEERVLISTLQRIYRHLYFRLCDMADFAKLLGEGGVDFRELRKAADLGGIWPGAATFLLLISEYANSYGAGVEIPAEVLAAAPSPDLRVHLGGQFLRVPKKAAAGLYAAQLLSAGRHADLRAMWRLPLLPPLAISALLAYRLTGNDKGVW